MKRSRISRKPLHFAARERCHAGFTVVELMVAFALAGLLLSLVAPSFRNAVAASELRERSDALVEAMTVARGEAIKRGVRVDVCPSVDRMVCSATAPWAAGWLTFVNETGSDSPALGATVLRRERPAPPGITIAANRPIADYLSFTSLGHARRHDGALQMGTFVVCRSGQNATKVVLANSGRVRVDTTREACP